MQEKGIEQEGGWRGGGAEWIPPTKCDASARARRRNEEKGKTRVRAMNTTILCVCVYGCTFSCGWLW